MMRWALIVGMLAVATAGWTTTADSAERPNIVVIMADDMGWSDLGCYGGEIATPNIDRLAMEGVRFTQFYNTARCCPTRAALLTGLYPHEAGIGHMMEDLGHDAYRGDLNQQCVTIAEVLRTADYRNYMAGKWHVTKKIKPEGDDDRRNWPLQRGFDRFYGTIHGAGSFFDPNSLVRDNRLISPYDDAEYQPATSFYYTDAIRDHAVRFIADHAREHRDRPFFLYVAFTAPHWPLHALPEDMAKYRGKYDAGHAAVRAARLEKQKALGIVAADQPLAPAQGESWDKVADREFESRCMETYAAMIDRLDQGVGRIVDELRRQGKLDNTLILFLQDNGGCAEPMGRAKKMPAPRGRADQPSLPPLPASFLQPDMIPKQTRDGFPMRQGYGVLPGGPDTYHAYGEAWANVSNTPFREFKHWVHEGGISSPLVAHWPAGIDAPLRSKLVADPAHLIDIMATCVELSGAAYPQRRNGVDIRPNAGVSLAPAFRGQPLERREPLYWEHEGNKAIRDGKWKLVAKHPGAWALYDIERDRAEQDDLAARTPEVVKRMSGQWEAWANRVGVRPWPVRQAAKRRAAAANPTSSSIAKSDDAPQERPNILVIYTDDHGIGDVSAYRPKADVRTPNIDALAARGMRFTNMRANATVCSPSRAALLTGRYADRVGVPGVIRTQAADSWGYLHIGVPTLPQRLGELGYHSAIVGKWHLGLESPNTPTERGFNHFHGFLGDMMDSYVTHLRHGRNYMRLETTPIEPQGHATDLFTAWAQDYLRSRAKTPNQPFFLYLAYNAPHFPIEPPADWLEKVKARSPELPAARAQNVALVEHLDDGIGKVLSTLEELDLARRTFVVFTSDNGGSLPHAQNNDPWRDGKQSHYDGGLRVPFVVRWPGRVVEGTTNDYAGLTFDIFPTAVELAGGKPEDELDAVSLLPALRGEPMPPDRELYFVRREGGPSYGGKSYEAIIRGDWKLMQNNPYSPLELYNLKDDPFEQNDLASQRRDLVNPLNAALRRHIQRGGRVPWQP
ncbi:MAG: sulfatase-like hydrolase/transferase [Pirellulales bacterium]